MRRSTRNNVITDPPSQRPAICRAPPLHATLRASSPLECAQPCWASVETPRRGPPRRSSELGQTVSTLDWVVIVSYALGLAGIALYHWPKMKKQDDLFLAGRSMRRWPVAISMYMALFSTNSFVGGVGWVNRPKGTVWITLQNAGIMMAVPLVIWLYPSLFYRLRITTAYEYLERRFSYPVRAVASLLFIGARIMWMSTMLYAASLLRNKVLPMGPLAVLLGQLHPGRGRLRQPDLLP